MAVKQIVRAKSPGGIQVEGKYGTKKPIGHTASGKPVFGYNSEGVPICAGKYADGRICQRTRIRKNGRCGRHGGKALKGPLSPRFKNGNQCGYATILTGQNREMFLSFLQNPQLISLREDVALINMELAKLVRDLNSIPIDIVPQLLSFTDQLQHWLEIDADLNRKKVKFERFISLVRDLDNAMKVYDSLERRQEHKRKLVETQHRISEKAGTSIPYPAVHTFFNHLMMRIRANADQYIVDEQQRKAYIRAMYDDVSRVADMSAMVVVGKE